jgi:hypothetical protein
MFPVEAGINDPDTLCASLLHDTLEDTDTFIEELVEVPHSGVSLLSVTLLIRADELCISKYVAPHCSLDLQFRRAL